MRNGRRLRRRLLRRLSTPRGNAPGPFRAGAAAALLGGLAACALCAIVAWLLWLGIEAARWPSWIKNTASLAVFLFYGGLAFCYTLALSLLEAAGALARKVEDSIAAACALLGDFLQGRFGEAMATVDEAFSALAARLRGLFIDETGGGLSGGRFAWALALLVAFAALKAVLLSRMRAAAMRGMLKPALLLAEKTGLVTAAFVEFKFKMFLLRLGAHLALAACLLAGLLAA